MRRIAGIRTLHGRIGRSVCSGLRIRSVDARTAMIYGAGPWSSARVPWQALLFRSRGGIQYVEHAEGHGDKMYEAVCCSRSRGHRVKTDVDRFTDPGPTKMWIKVKNPKAPAATRVIDGTF